MYNYNVVVMLQQADKLLSQDFKGVLDRIISLLPNADRQIMLFSATFPQSVEQFMVSQPASSSSNIAFYHYDNILMF